MAQLKLQPPMLFLRILAKGFLLTHQTEDRSLNKVQKGG